jgi:16S rRNA (guanine(966)-N(2))-methyltransferase RsmD
MRVIAGSHGGRRLKAPPGRRTRPTSDRVREALFAMLGELGGDSVLDLFAGTGALGIEALSRGAGRVVFVERDGSAARVLGENLAALGIAGEQVELRRGEALAALRSARRRAEAYDLILIDPPYGQARLWGPRLSELLPAILLPRGRIVVESDRREPLEIDAPRLAERRYGDTSITIHTHPWPDQQAP